MKKEQEEKYEAPQTKRTQVSLESGICVASGQEVKNDQSQLETEGHDQGELIQAEGDWY